MEWWLCVNVCAELVSRASSSVGFLWQWFRWLEEVPDVNVFHLLALDWLFEVFTNVFHSAAF